LYIYRDDDVITDTDNKKYNLVHPKVRESELENENINTRQDQTATTRSRGKVYRNPARNHRIGIDRATLRKLTAQRLFLCRVPVSSTKRKTGGKRDVYNTKKAEREP